MKKGAIVKALGAVETLGCCTTLCSDKTGTLTENNMQVTNIFSNGKITTSKTFNYAQNTELIKAITLCNNAKIASKQEIVGDATETSLFKFCLSCHLPLSRDERLYEIPFSSETKTMLTVNQVGQKCVAYAKGAFDYLIASCDKIMINGQVVALNQEHLTALYKAHSEFTKNAQRVIAVAMKPLESFEKNAKNSQNLFKNMIFLGFFGIFDPPRKEVKKAVSECKTAGIKPIMITGDHPQTALSVARAVGIANSENEVITGKELSKLSAQELAKIISQYSVFARVTPSDKVKIVKALKLTGKIVAMTGDGVNDAPSLKVSDIGTSMGTGTDVTKSVADLILTDNNFSTLVVAVKEGRTIYSNIQKTLQFLISTNAVEVLGIFITALLLKNAVFLLPGQILFINLITDSLPAFALGLEPSEKDIMLKPPRNSKESFFSGVVGSNIIYQAFIQTLFVLVMFVVVNAKLSNDVASTMVFLTICYMQIVHAINCKTNLSLTKINIFNNKIFNLSFFALFVLITAVGIIPVFQTAFKIVPLNFLQWAVVMLVSFAIIPAVELGKFFINKNAQNNKIAKKSVAQKTKTVNGGAKRKNTAAKTSGA